MEVTVSESLELLSSQAIRVMDRIETIGEVVPHGTPLGDAMLDLMDIIMDMDSAIYNAQRAVAYCGSVAIRGRPTTREEQEELLQSRRDRRSWEEKQQAMEKQLSDSQLKIKNLQELNTMLMERARSATTPSSGFCSASHSPRSIEEEDSATPPNAAAAVEKKEEKKEEKEEPISVPPPKPERRPQTETLDYTPDFSSATFKDSLRLHTPRKELSPIADLDGTIQLSDSPEVPTVGPLCSTFKGDRSVYHTPVTSKKNMRRRSSSLSDVMKKIFTPKQAKRVKNPILEVMDD